MKLVHLVGFIIKKFVTMHGHTNVKFAKVMFVQISEVVMAVALLDGHKILSCDRLIKSYNLLCNDKQSGSSAKFIFILSCT